MLDVSLLGIVDLIQLTLRVLELAPKMIQLRLQSTLQKRCSGGNINKLYNRKSTRITGPTHLFTVDLTNLLTNGKNYNLGKIYRPGRLLRSSWLGPGSFGNTPSVYANNR